MKPQCTMAVRSTIFVLAAVMSIALPVVGSAASYYVDSIGGLDTNAGTSTGAPWKTLSKVSSTTFAQGDTVYFLRDRQFYGTLIANGSGTSGSKITIDAYGAGTNKPVIIGTLTTARKNQDAAIKLVGNAWWIIRNIEVQAPTTNGLLLAGATNILVEKVDFNNVQPRLGSSYQVAYENGQCINLMDNDNLGTPAVEYVPCVNVTIDHCTFRRSTSGVMMESATNCIVQFSYFSEIANIPALFAGNHAHDSADGHPHSVQNCRFTGNVFANTNTDGVGWNVIMFGGTSNCYAEYNEIRYHRPAVLPVGDPYWAHGGVDHQIFDFDTRCLNSVVQYNYTHHNFSNLMQNYFVGNALENGGCIFRYNLSVGEGGLNNHPLSNNGYGLQIYNNTFYNFKGTAGRNPVANDLFNSTVKNNIFSMISVLPGTWSNPAGSSHNLYHNATKPAGETGSINGNPAFVWGPNPPHGLQITSGSPARNAGTPITGNGGLDWWLTSWTGTSYPGGAADMGAHEYTGAAVPINAPNFAENAVVSTNSSVENWGWYRVALTDGETNSVPVFYNTSGVAVSPGSSGWSSQSYATQTPTPWPEWVTIDLGASRTFNKVVLHPRNDDDFIGENFPVDFYIQTSPDNVTWTTRATIPNWPKPANQPQVFTFTAATARYVNVTMTKLRPMVFGGTTSYSAAFAEIEVRNDNDPVPVPFVPVGNLALAKTVTASSSVEGYAWFKPKLTDGQRTSVAAVVPPTPNTPMTTATHGSAGWSSIPTSSNHTEQVRVDLQAIASVSRVDLYPRSDAPYVGENFPINFTIQTSADNVTWTTRYTASEPTKPTGVKSYTFTAASARYVKVVATTLRPFGSPASYAMAFAEMEVY